MHYKLFVTVSLLLGSSFALPTMVRREPTGVVKESPVVARDPTVVRKDPTPVQKRNPSATVDAPVAVRTINNRDGIGAGSQTYRQYNGNGTPAQGWPDISKWVSFEDMFNNNKNSMFVSCDQWGVPRNSGPEVGAIYDAIQQIAQQSGVDHRFILAVIMNESSGCVRVPTTKAPGYDIFNPGLMQDFNGYYTCNHSQNDQYNTGGGVTTPCPKETIVGMVREGAVGTNAGDGLASIMNHAYQKGARGAQVYYVAARWYNSGENSVPVGGNLNTNDYVKNIANRLTGWTN